MCGKTDKIFDERLKKVVNEWNEISESDWYMGYRKDEVIQKILDDPQSAFHKKTWEVIHNTFSSLRDKKILVPSSGDNRAVFAFAALGAEVVSCDICEKQLDYAREIAEKFSLSINFQVEDSMKLSGIESDTYDLVYTSEGVLVWINDLSGMYKNIARVLKKGGVYVNYEIHPFCRPFSYDDGKPQGKEIIIRKDYEMTGPFEDGTEFFWRLQDILNAICDSELKICRLEEMHDEKEKGHFWFYEEEREKMSQEQIDCYYDIAANPLSALPQWFTVCCRK